MSIDLQAVRAAAEAVPDPELPPVTLGMLGVVEDVSLHGDRVQIALLPTFAGCPATEMIVKDVRAAAESVAGAGTVDVEVRFAPAWTADRISEEGRAALRSFGIAASTDIPATAKRLPVLSLEDTATDRRTCPYCGSDQTERQSMFGPTPCRDVRYCNACHQPFEAFKSL